MTDTIKLHQAYRVCTNADTEAYDKLSIWSDASDVDTDISGVTYSLESQLKYVEGTLLAHSGTVRIPSSGTSDLITADGMLDIYVPSNKSNLVPLSIVQNTGYVVLTFPVLETDTTIRVRCWK